MLQGLPDLARPLDLGGPPGTVYAGYQGPDLAVVLPDRIELGREFDGRPALLVTLVRRDGQQTAGRLEVGVSVEADPARVGAHLATGGVPARAVVAQLDGGVLEVRATLGPATEPDLFAPLAVGPDELTRARVVAELDAAGATLAARLVEDATVPVTARLRVAVPAVAPRLPLRVRVDPAVLARRLADRFGEGAVVEIGRTAAALAELLDDGTIALEDGDTSGVERVALADTLRLRLVDLVAAPHPSADVRDALLPVAGVAPGSVRVDLAEAAPATVHRVLTLDPFATARTMADGRPDLVRRIDVPALALGATTVSVASNLPEPVAGLQALIADLRFPPAPGRPQAVSASVALDPPTRSGDARVDLAPGETPAPEARLRALLPTLSDEPELSGPWRTVPGDHVLLGARDFPVPLTVLRASVGLVADATVEVRRAGSSIPLARLDAATPALALPRTDDGARVLHVAPLGPGRPVELPLEPVARVDLDPATLPGFGRHDAELRAAPEATPLDVEWRRDGDTAAPPTRTRLTPRAPAVAIGWIATSPFRPGILWRVVGSETWSEPAEGPVIAVGPPAAGTEPEPVVVNGVELRPDPADPTTWSYVPPGPFVDRGPDGAPALSVLDVGGGTAFLQLTTRLDGDEQARAALLDGLRAQVGPGVAAVRAQPVTVRRVALQTAVGADWTDVASGTSSGLPPWTTALSAMLTADQLTAVRAATGGERGRARLLAELDLPGRGGVRVGVVASSSSSVTVTVNGRTEVIERHDDAAAPPVHDGGAEPARTVERTRDLADPQQ